MNKKIPILPVVTLLVACSIFIISQKWNKSEAEKIRENHANFIKNHPFTKTNSLSKKERLKKGLPPNQYFEQEYLNELNPRTGTTDKVELLALQKKINEERFLRKVPGDAVDNGWEERGSNNVGGRTRALIFDPNDTTNETVFAGGVSGGLWKNTNISNPASQWTKVNIPENLAISSIAIDPNNSKIWYVGTGESYVSGDVNGTGVWRSVDGGNSWNNVFGGVEGKSIFESNAKITINSPANISGDIAAVLATDFGGNLNVSVSGNLVLVNDGILPNDDACTAIINAPEVNGNIAFLRRGSCTFVEKANAAQSAGAKAVVIINNETGNAVGMAGTDAGITIPVLMVSKRDGEKIVDNLAAGVTITLSNSDNNSGFNVSNGIQHVNDVIVRNNNGISEVFVAAGESSYRAADPRTLIGVNDVGLYKSNDGLNFVKLAIPKAGNGDDFQPNNLDIAADNSIFLSTTPNVFGVGGGAILKSTNGTTFTKVHQVPGGLRTEIVCSKSNSNVVYILAHLSGNLVGIYKTVDNFSKVNTLALPNDADEEIPANDFTRGQAFYDLLLGVDPNNDNIVYVGGIDLFKSTNGGTNWAQISKWSNNNKLANLKAPLVHADQHGISFSSSSRIVFSNDGGVYFSNDGASSINSRNLGYNTLQFYTVGVAPTNILPGDNFIAGAQDNGTQLFENLSPGIGSSRDVSGGDGAASFFDQDGVDKYVIVNFVYNAGIQLIDLNTGIYRTIHQESSENGDFINQQDLDSNLDILYSNYSNGSNYVIRRYSNLKSGTVSKVNLTNALMDAFPSALKVSPYTTTATNLYVGLRNGRVLLITNANGSTSIWSEITGPDFFGTVSDIEFGATENEIFVTMHNYGVESIWYSNNRGATWASKQGDLPDIPVKAILQNPLNRNEVIIGTELGVWKTSDITTASPKWVQSYNGMSNVKVTDLDLRDDNTVFAATYGRGVFSGKFTAAVASVNDVLVDKKAFTVYPTISNGNFTVFAKNGSGKSKINIFDISGRQVYKTHADFSSQEKQKVSVNLNAGIYIVNIVDENNKKSSSKIIIK
ncbi:T9SS type A sorting domain-containing protein [Polaribacter batillariae]|uniref:T9SS type A sorting domain-containing protein n=1 Tax=Polaribacter batillariae TaxID=2808900 RepID=A0ABX7T069_9FLAO|nr:PA domain-containing protein [Polaribacter batillariae]QTD39141.1 T9SS type A sorting domain-containing protein [Polaribacter batillariae]